MEPFDQLLHALDPDPVKRGREFEQLVKWFFQSHPTYRAELVRVWLWDEWPGRWGTDAGIDLVAKDREGRLWAIQAKAYSHSHSITKRDVDTFLSESSRSTFSFRVLIATTDLIGATAMRTVRAQEKPVSLLLRNDLASAPVEWPRNPKLLRIGRPRAKSARRHQTRAIRDCVDGFASSPRCTLVMACGTGKTIVSIGVASELEAKRTLILVPSLSLLSQTVNEWAANSTGDFEFLAVCSDDNVVDSDALVSNTSALGFPVTTDPQQIATFLRRRRSCRAIIFSTYQSSQRIAEAMSLGGVPRLDLVVADEAHRVAGPRSAAFATVLDDSKIRARRRLFMTATPRYFTGRLVAEARESDFEVASMDDVSLFGPVVHRLSFAQAISQDLLTDYQVVVVGVGDETYLDWARRGRFVTIDGLQTTDARTLASQVGVVKAIKAFDLRRMITFHGRVAAARQFSIQLPNVVKWMPSRQRPVGTLVCDYVSGTMSTGIRNARIQHLRSTDDERVVLSNARCLTEGIDVPLLDAVAFIDPRRAEVDIVQAVGRAIRRSPQKKIGTIVVPIFVDASSADAPILDDSAFEPIWNVLTALRAHDEELAERLDEIARRLGRGDQAPIELPGKIKVILPERVTKRFATAFSAKLVERTSSPWEFWFGMLEAYAQREGDALVPKDYEENGLGLGAWVNGQRSRRNQLSESRRIRLDTLPGWTWNARTDLWEQGHSALRTYADREGHSRVPAKHLEGDFRLGGWVNVQRSKRGTMDAARVARLEAMPGWTWAVAETRWEEAFALLCSFADRTGTSRPPNAHVEEGFALHAWVTKQRATRDRLDDSRVKRLESLPGWSWQVHDDAWAEGYRHLLEFVLEHGDCRVPDGYDKGGYKLGSWVRRQRDTWENLPPERKDMLASLSGWTVDPADDAWSGNFDLLASYADREGHSQPTSTYVEGTVRLGGWVAAQRTNREKLTDERSRRLESLPGWSWNVILDQWEATFEALLRYVDSHGTSRVSPRHVESGVKLGSWVGTQRNRFARGLMPTDQQQRLESLPGWTWDLFSSRWDEAFELLARYAKREGHSRVPAEHVEEGFRLGGWVATVRSHRYRQEGERSVRLESLPGWSWRASTDKWEDAFSILAEFVLREGHARVPQKHRESGFPLGLWLAGVRQHPERQTNGRRERLEALPGWSWDASSRAWERGIAALTVFAEREGHTDVPRHHVEADVKLGQWVRNQRAARDRLPRDKKLELERLPSWAWLAHQAAWEHGYSELLIFAHRVGHAAPTTSCVIDDFRLGQWVSVQRSTRTSMPDDRRQRLEALPGWKWVAKPD